MTASMLVGVEGKIVIRLIEEDRTGIRKMLCALAFRDEHVLAFQVSVQDVFAVDVVQRQDDLYEPAHCVFKHQCDRMGQSCTVESARTAINDWHTRNEEALRVYNR